MATACVRAGYNLAHHALNVSPEWAKTYKQNKSKCSPCRSAGMKIDFIEFEISANSIRINNLRSNHKHLSK